MRTKTVKVVDSSSSVMVTSFYTMRMGTLSTLPLTMRTLPSWSLQLRIKVSFFFFSPLLLFFNLIDKMRRPPYITVVSSTCAVIWPTATSKPTLGPLPRTTPVLGPTFDYTENSFNVLPASAWRSHFGVNTHCSQV
jgi:hypothetical protein